MQLKHEKPDTEIYVKHYIKGKLDLSIGCFNHSVIITQNMIVKENWLVCSHKELTLQKIKPLLKLGAHICLIGTGEKYFIPQKDIVIAFARIGKSVDFMSTAAVCRTFNILAHEGRHVAAAIIV